MHTHLEADAEPLPAGELTPVRVELFPFAHAFRAGLAVRITVDAPGGNRAVWAFDTIARRDGRHRRRRRPPVVARARPIVPAAAGIGALPPRAIPRAPCEANPAAPPPPP